MLRRRQKVALSPCSSLHMHALCHALDSSRKSLLGVGYLYDLAADLPPVAAALFEISNLLNTGLDKQSLAVLVELVGMITRRCAPDSLHRCGRSQLSLSAPVRAKTPVFIAWGPTESPCIGSGRLSTGHAFACTNVAVACRVFFRSTRQVCSSKNADLDAG